MGVPGLREPTARGGTLGQRVGVDDGDRGVLGEDSGREEAGQTAAYDDGVAGR